VEAALALVPGMLDCAPVRIVVGIYTRAPGPELERFVKNPKLLAKLDDRVALTDGRAIDLGRCWEELGCLLEGGISTPRSGPTVGDTPIASDDQVVWSVVGAERVKTLAAELSRMTREAFYKLYRTDDDEDTADAAPGERTERLIDRAAYLWRKFEQLRDHYAVAARRGESMLVRIGERPYEEDAPDSMR
jgi:hypothetical protein